MARADRKALGFPEDLPGEARSLWPDLTQWPTREAIAEFERKSHRQVNARLAVLSGLRSWAAIDTSPIWAWASAILTLSVAGLGVTIAVNIGWIQLIALVLTVALDLAFLSVMMTLSTTADLRRRRAQVWVKAFEDHL